MNDSQNDERVDSVFHAMRKDLKSREIILDYRIDVLRLRLYLKRNAKELKIMNRSPDWVNPESVSYIHKKLKIMIEYTENGWITVKSAFMNTRYDLVCLHIGHVLRQSKCLYDRDEE